MTIAEIVMERAQDLARAGVADEEAVSELLSSAGGNRVAVVVARRHLMEDAEQEGRAERAVELLDEVLRRLPAE
jgi:hypothetical protein